MGLFGRFSHNKQPGPSSMDEPREVANRSFRGVMVRPGDDGCCQLVETIADERFLLEDVPMLPLTLCDAEACRCTYERFEDRRAGTRRASDIAFDMASALHDQESRNSKTPGRRSKDTLEYEI